MNSKTIKKFASQCGAKVCGIAPVERFSCAPKGFGPLDLYPQTQSVIAFALQSPRSSLNLPSNIPYTVNELITLHESHRIGLELVLHIESEGYEAVLVPSEPYEYWDAETKTGKGLVSLKHIAHVCGLGVFGKNQLLYNANLGNLMRLGAVLTNAILEPDAMVEREICKSNCRLCISSCPSGALSDTGVDQLKCREFGERKTLKGEPYYGCNVCRRVCPNVSGVKN
jgi:epoxyqueuosine reductase